MKKENRNYPCDVADYDGNYRCPFEDGYGGYSSEMCRNCCGLGVDESEIEEEVD